MDDYVSKPVSRENLELALVEHGRQRATLNGTQSPAG
jgi:two-component SAPR family response regulator